MNAITPAKAADIIEAVIARGDIANLNPEERARYYVRVCESIGLNPMTRPFEYITLNGKLTLYARKDATDQLRAIHKVSLEIVGKQYDKDLLTVHVRASSADGRKDEDFGSVSMIYPDTYRAKNGDVVKHPRAGQPLQGEDRANTILKAVTKAKRRATLSICGLGFLDETEVEDIEPTAVQAAPEATHSDAPRIGELQLARLRSLINERGINEPRLLKVLKVATLADLPANRLKEAVEMINSKPKKAA